MFIYQADVFCDDCGLAIRAAIAAEGKAPENPDDEHSYDSDEFPKGPYPDDEESDSPQHCGNGESCFNAVELPSGHKIGMLLSTSLTDEGVRYLKEAIEEGGEVAEFWQQEFSAAGYDLPSDDDEDDD